ncbi:MAG TPA: OmpA family protein [Candidatus Eisenbacteria bacterium]|nr:OmpA family protein [Candidatus Eisenbacteria bacterium]
MTAIALLVAGAATGCSSLSKSEQGAIIGAAAGGVAGGVIGNNNGSTAKGAIIGAVIGGAAGAIIGHQMDKQAQELQSIPGATVERVGEGIQVTFDSGLLFDFDSDVIKGAAQSNLNQLAASLTKYSDSNLLIAGHTDDVGSDSYNQTLSEKRAAAAARYLANQGVTRTIKTVGLGEREPVAANTTDDGRAKNRRVEVAIYANETMVEKARQQAAGG